MKSLNFNKLMSKLYYVLRTLKVLSLFYFVEVIYEKRGEEFRWFLCDLNSVIETDIDSAIKIFVYW